MIGLRAIAAAALSALLLPALAAAQLSPGPLHEAHASMEGLRHCLSCHELGKRISAAKCLDCHTLLRDRIEAGRGLHANGGHAICESCHSDHQGREYEMIDWGEGRERFDHALTGTPLRGVHAELRCDDCHAARRIGDRAGIVAAGKDPSRTHLGLSAECASCHVDPHSPSLDGDCLRCHGERAWRPAESFEHARTRFPLTGLHGNVACEKCHPGSRTGAEDGERSVIFRRADWERCDGCHADPHAGNFRQRCDDCHDTGGWRRISSERFDHDATRYPLRGRHAGLTCEKCHATGAPHRPLPHERCTDCHSDLHAGQFANSAGGGECSGCHGVEGFRPARYPVLRHAESRYPLTGAHLAVPCSACHAPPDAPAGGRFRFQTTACFGCHADPHRLAESGPAPDCESCHSTDSWRSVRFDHARTRFPLADAHARAACAACHPPVAGASSPVFKAGKKRCADCHADPHLAQFHPSGGAVTDCERCHDSRDWLAVGFDHERDATFSLRGAHAAVRCEQCHPPLTGEGAASLRFKPLSGECRTCHAGQGGEREGVGGR